MMTDYLIKPVDSWFFKDALPFEVVGGNTLTSIFPPSARTVFAALLNNPDETDVHDRGKAIAAQCVTGPYLVRKEDDQTWARLYPLPLNILAKKKEPQSKQCKQCKQCKQKQEIDYRRLSIDIKNDKPLRCDFGKVLLPYLPKSSGEDKGESGRGYKPIENAWVTASGMSAILAGEAPKTEDIVELTDFLKKEGRVGLARDNATRTAREGYLYETRHIRLDSWHICLDSLCVDKKKYRVALGASLTEANARQGLVRFGGEGRMAEVSQLPNLTTVSPVELTDRKPQGLILYLITPARLGRFEQGKPANGKTDYQTPSQPRHVPPGLKKNEGQENHTVWTGNIIYSKAGQIHADIKLTVHSAVIGKPLREGGWKTGVHKNSPRVVKSLIPAGSLWFCTVEGDLNEAIIALQGANIGEDAHLGRGELAVGLWF